jgi:hypothetical protein
MTHYVDKPGFYYCNDPYDERCYYLTGEKSGNKWIYIAGIDGNKKVPVPNPEWMSLVWTCLPKKDELEGAEYSEENPTNFKIKI